MVFILRYGCKDSYGNQHLFHGNASMLKGVAVKIYKMIVIIGVNQVVVVQAKNIGSGHMCTGKAYALGLQDFKNLFGIIIQVPSLFVTQVHRGLPVSDYLYRIVNPHCPMIGGDDQGEIVFLQLL
jgi:hypothetical protein